MNSRYKKPPAPPPSAAELRLLLNEAQPTVRQRVEDAEQCESRRIGAVDEILEIVRNEPLVQRVLDEIVISAIPPRTDAYKQLLKTGVPHRMEGVAGDLFRFLFLAGLRILLAEDQGEELRRFIGRRKRGEHKKNNEYRDRMIAADVRERVLWGAKRDDACTAVAEACGTSFERVLAIYNRLRDSQEVLAELGCRELLTGKRFPEPRRVRKSKSS
jgi:hypothetical protein